ncbi:pilus assembly protein [Azotobacter chroococcum subsp. isscasi]|uniref:pilus assembly protein n=1 Tax=Azotobacter chroococcum TaxID=353 RepID=UPI00103AF175|nr:pilus assembly protein [Azotobacter chroococcum]TBW07577.1 pilus assembly protein [Azotobacter chroococcum subsp. isscasi]
MRPIELDFQRKAIASPPGWALLVAGLLLAGVLWTLQQRIDADRVRDAEVLARLQPGQGGEVRQAPLSKADSLAQQASLAEMRRVSAALNLPWEGLFATLEALPLKDVALLGLTPDARKRLLRISAEARNLEAMLEFHQRLEDSDGLSDVSLLDHEVLVQVAERPIRFNLLATWEVPDGRP